eukprot:gene27499-33210_t
MSVFVWGSNKHKQLIDQTGLHCYAPSTVASSLFDDQTPLEVASGEQHALVLCESGDVYAFGGGQDGQLGNGQRWGTASSHKVKGFDHETILHVAAEEEEVRIDNEHEEVRAGQLTGLAQDQGVMVQPEAQSRRERAAAAARSGSRRLAQQPTNTPRLLRDIVRESTERWMLSSEDADEEYFEELRAMGYHLEDKEQAEERLQGRGREYHGMLQMTCRRQVQLLPIRVRSLSKVRVASISAGYAHVLALSVQGRVYAAGYNDRGQLGLGHRINTSLFKEVDFLANKMVVQVVCGQQHSVCRAVDRLIEGVEVGSKLGADVYIWGNGVLGQLGLGRKGTTKGRLLPTLVPGLHAMFPAGIVDISAGANFTAAVTIQGSVYSFGHAEYNQHGSGAESHRDYVDPYHYFEPRKVPIDAHIVSVHCGAVFTIATDSMGIAYSWGWNESGVLGQGFSHFSSSPQKIVNSAFYAAGKIAQISCGAKHVLALVTHQGSPWMNAYRHILQEPKYFDCVLVTESNFSLPCHRCILAARSSYLKGYMQAAQLENMENGNLHIYLAGPQYNNITLKALLEFIYLDRLSIPAHKQREVLQISQDLMLGRLEELLFRKIIPLDAASSKSTSTSSFVVDMRRLLNDAHSADVIFTHHHWRMFAHCAIVSRIPYFDTLLSSNFADSKKEEVVDGKLYRKVDVTGLLDDMSLDTLALLLDFAYTYTIQTEEGEEVDVNVAMALLVAANRLNFTPLAQLCERCITLSIRHGTEDDLLICRDFAHQYNLARLERQCMDMLRALRPLDFAVTYESKLPG